MGYSRAQIVSRAKAYKGQAYSVGYCQQWTRTVMGWPAAGDQDSDGDADAVDGWKWCQRQSGIRVVKAAAIPAYSQIPAGVALYWSGGSHGYGHAAVSLGGGKVMSTDLPRSGRIGQTTINGPVNAWGHRFLGYADPNPAAAAPSAPAAKARPAPGPLLT